MVAVSSSSTSSTLPFLLLLLVQALLLISSASTYVPLEGFRAELTHIDSGRNFTKFELFQRCLNRSEQRVSRLLSRTKVVATVSSSSNGTNVVVAVHVGEGEYIMDLAIGTPSVPFPSVVDTGSDLIWTQCKPCEDCYNQSTPIYDPSSSTTFSKLPCSGDLCQALGSDGTGCENYECKYSYSYGDSSYTKGYLASETMRFGPSADDVVPVAGIGFGCGEANTGGGMEHTTGLVGLGRGPLSLVSQLGLGKFSYCLMSDTDGSKKSPLLFGSLAKIDGTGVHTTPLIKSPYQPSFYYLNLKGISVGGTPLRFPNSTFSSLNDDGSGGFIIDSGTYMTQLESEGYRQVKNAFISQMKLPVANGSTAVVGLDLCFSADPSSSGVEIPKFVFHFDGADLDLPSENYTVYDEENQLLCLAVAESSGISILGSLQQENFQILYDLQDEKLSFAPAQCDQM